MDLEELINILKEEREKMNKIKFSIYEIYFKVGEILLTIDHEVARYLISEHEFLERECADIDADQFEFYNKYWKDIDHNEVFELKRNLEKQEIVHMGEKLAIFLIRINLLINRIDTFSSIVDQYSNNYDKMDLIEILTQDDSNIKDIKTNIKR